MTTLTAPQLADLCHSKAEALAADATLAERPSYDERIAALPLHADVDGDACLVHLEGPLSTPDEAHLLFVLMHWFACRLDPIAEPTHLPPAPVRPS